MYFQLILAFRTLMYRSDEGLFVLPDPTAFYTTRELLYRRVWEIYDFGGTK